MNDIEENIGRLTELFQQGLLSESEFESQKQILLSQYASPEAPSSTEVNLGTTRMVSPKTTTPQEPSSPFLNTRVEAPAFADAESSIPTSEAETARAVGPKSEEDLSL